MRLDRIRTPVATLNAVARGKLRRGYQRRTEC